MREADDDAANEEVHTKKPEEATPSSTGHSKQLVAREEEAARGAPVKTMSVAAKFDEFRRSKAKRAQPDSSSRKKSQRFQHPVAATIVAQVATSAGKALPGETIEETILRGVNNFRKRARDGDPEAQATLGLSYWTGLGQDKGAKDLDVAARLWAKAAKQVHLAQMGLYSAVVIDSSLANGRSYHPRRPPPAAGSPSRANLAGRGVHGGTRQVRGAEPAGCQVVDPRRAPGVRAGHVQPRPHLHGRRRGRR